MEAFSFLHTLAKRHRGIMNPGNSISPNSRAWRGLYKAALFEVDKTRLPDRIAQAEKALALRAREFVCSVHRIIQSLLLFDVVSSCA